MEFKLTPVGALPSFERAGLNGPNFVLGAEPLMSLVSQVTRGEANPSEMESFTRTNHYESMS